MWVKYRAHKESREYKVRKAPLGQVVHKELKEHREHKDRLG